MLQNLLIIYYSSDFHLAHNACITSLEAQLLNIPCAQILSDDSYNYFKDHIDIAYFKIKSIKDFQMLFTLTKQTKSDLIELNKYVKKYLQSLTVIFVKSILTI